MLTLAQRKRKRVASVFPALRTGTSAQLCHRSARLYENLEIPADQSAQALEEALLGLRSEEFSEEEREFNKAMNELSELSQDQKDIANETDEIYKRYADKVAKMQSDKAESARPYTS